jgi:DNA processing protein
MDERIYWMGFSLFSGIGPKRFTRLLKTFRSVENAWNANEKALQEGGLGPLTAARFIDFRSNCDLVEYAERFQKQQISFLTFSDPSFPQLLREIANPPFVLFVKGTSIFNEPVYQQTVAIVGTRKITDYGREVTERLTADLVLAGCVIISGLAYGVDAVAHNTTIYNGGKTIAVLGCGVDCCYPSANQPVYDRIIQSGGAVVSEFPPGMLPSVGSFPSRNRIIAGLSRAVIVTEGAADSGALYTAKDALAIGRPVFAVPGPITSSLSKGPNGLISQGALLLTQADDVLKSLSIKTAIRSTEHVNIKGETAEEQEIIDLLQNEHMHFDELVKRTGSTPSQIGSLLSIIEMKGFIKRLDGDIFALQG